MTTVALSNEALVEIISKSHFSFDLLATNVRTNISDDVVVDAQSIVLSSCSSVLLKCGTPAGGLAAVQVHWSSDENGSEVRGEVFVCFYNKCNKLILYKNTMSD